jgi:hypothetical protein
MDWEKLKFYASTKEVILYHDMVESRFGEGLLRGLPAIAHVFESLSCESRFTYPKTWRQLGNTAQFGLYPHQWIRIQDLADIEWPMTFITNSHYEHDEPYSIRAGVSKVRHSGNPAVIVSDDAQFRFQDDDRPLDDNGYAKALGEYDAVFDSVADQYEEAGYPLPLTDTKNLFLQDNAILFNRIADSDGSLNTTKGLFETLHTAPYLPLYTALTNIFNKDDRYGAVALPEDELDGFRKWLGHRIDRSKDETREIAEVLNESVLAEQTNFTTASQVNHPTLRQAETFLEDITPVSNPIERRYSRWLTEVTNT